MKSYTDIDQSKKLAEILPLESADYTRLGKDEDNVLTRSYFESCSSELKEWIDKDEIYPCWSLAALLRLMPNFNMFKRTIECRIETTNHLIDKAWDLVDAAFEMVCWLKEHNKL